MGNLVLEVTAEQAKKITPAWGLVDKKDRVLRMEPVTQTLAVFDTREAARKAQTTNTGTKVVKLMVFSWPKT